MEHLKFLECNDCVVATVKKSHFAKIAVFTFQDFLTVPLTPIPFALATMMRKKPVFIVNIDTHTLLSKRYWG